MSQLRALACIITAALVLSSGKRAGGQHADVSIADLKIGVNGVYKLGHWTPARVTLRSTADRPVSGTVTLRVIDGDGSPTVVRLDDVSAPAGGDATVSMLVKIGRPKEPIEVRLDSPARRVARTFAAVDKPTTEGEVAAPILATRELMVEVGRSIGLSRLERFFAQSSTNRPATALVENPEELPEEWLGYDGVDVVVLTTSDRAVNESWRKAGGRVKALDQWVRMGGKLVLCVGREGARVLAADSPLAVFAPGKFEGVVERREATWESFAGALAEPMQGADGGRPEPILTAKLSDVRGRVELSDGTDSSIPLVIRAPHGFGEVLFVAADLDRPPFAEWPARMKLFVRLLGRSDRLAGEQAARESNVQTIRLGYADLAGQLRSALGQFKSAAMVPFWLVFCLALGYAAALFPMEFAIARWLRPRFEAAWALFPLVLVAAAAGAGWLAVKWKGRDTLVEKVEVMDVDLASGAVRSHAWIGVYSPATDALDIGLTTAESGVKPIGKAQVSWLGLPGSGLGGMNSQMAASEMFERDYEFSGNGSVVGVPMTAWSSKAFEGSWQAGMAPANTMLGERPSDGQPLGVLKNDSGMSLREAVLFQDGWSYPLGTLAPGASVDVGRVQRLQTVHSYLTGRRTVGEKEQSTPYEPDGTDLGSIVRAILFHESAGGEQYTSLSNRIYDRLDATEHMQLGRAVLFAVGEPATHARVSATRGDSPQVDEEVAFYRFYIAVERSGRGDDIRPTVELRLD